MRSESGGSGTVRSGYGRPVRMDRITRDALSIGLATGVYAVSFGVLSVAAGLSVAQTCVLSLFCFTGASQFSYVSVLGAGGAVGGGARAGAAARARNGVYALSLADVARPGGLPGRS